MTKLFGVDIQAELANAIPSGDAGFPAITLTHSTPGTRTPGVPDGGTNPVVDSYTTRGIIAEYKKMFANGPDKWVMTTHMILLIAKPLADLGVKPQMGDRLTQNGVTYVIVRETGDPAEAQWTCYCVGA